MIYGQDEPTLFPVADLYDSGMIQMYINAAREQYNQNREDLKEFQKTFGDFVSPFAKDMQWVDANTRGRINEAMDYLQRNGIDPLRSAEGRAVLQRVINTTPRAEINARRANAKLGEEYLKARGQMIANGTYNDDYEQYLLNNLGLGRFEDFDSSMGTWTRTSPSQYKDLNEYTGHIFDKMDDSFIETKDGYDWFGVSDERRRQALTPSLAGIVNSDLGRYHYELARRDAAARLGRTPTENEVMQQFQDNIISSTSEYTHRTRKENDEYKRMRDYYWEDKLDASKSARDLQNKKVLENLKTDNEIRKYNATHDDATGTTGSSNGSGQRSSKETLSDAQYQLMRGTTGIIGKTSWGRNAGITNYTDFDPDWMDNILPAAQEEISWKFYNNSISGGTNQIVKTKDTSVIKYNPKTGKLEMNTPRNYFDINNYSSYNTSVVPPATTKQQITNLEKANRDFVNELSMDYTPAKFAKWTNRSTLSTDATMVNITNDTDAINRIISVDEMALSSAGVDRPIEDYEWSKNKTDSIRKKISNGEKLYMKSTGKIVTAVAADGAVHMYQLVKIYKDTSTKQNTHSLREETEVVGFDMGIDTYSNPNFGINNNTHVNLFFDENKDSDARWSGDQNVLNWEHINPSGISANAAYPALP